MALKSTLKSLETAVKKTYPRKHKEFGPPATEESLARLHGGVGFTLPADVLTLYAWHRSAPGLLIDEGTDDGADGWTLSDPDGVLEDHRAWSDLRAKAWSPAWLPLFTNGAGDNVCLDTRDGKLVALLHEEPEDPKPFAASLDAAFACVLARVNAGTWRGVPEKDPVPKIVARLSKAPANADPVFGNDVFRLLPADPRAVLEIVAEAEPLGVRASLLRKYEILAYLARSDADATRRSYLSYIAAIREEGGSHNPPFNDLRAFFERIGNRQWGAEVAELEALDKDYLLYKWLSACGRAAADDARREADAEERTDRFRALVADIDARLPKLAGARAARAACVMAAALHALGDAAACESAWTLASASDAGVAAVWRSHPLLASA